MSRALSLALVAGAAAAAVFHTLVAPKFLSWPRPDDGMVVELGDATYRVKAVVAPAASGIVLRLLSAILASTGILGQLLRRMLLNSNRVCRVRSLAWQIIRSGCTPLLFYPLKRLSIPESARHEKMAKEAEPVKKRPSKFNSVLDYHGAFKAHRTTPARVLDAVFTALDALPPDLRVFASLDSRDALCAEADASGQRYRDGKQLSVFDGVPVAFKDMVPMSGVNCTRGTHPSWGTGPYVKDDVVMSTLRQSGAIVLGLTVMTEFGTTPLGYSLHSQGPANAYDTQCYSGGSSSGSGLGAALGIFPVALGFDGGGSIRIPAAMQGVFGLKATWGRIAVDDDCCTANVAAGPMAGSAADAALFYEVIGPPCAAHFYQRLYGAWPLPPAHYSGFNRVDDLSDIRLGIFEEWFADCHPEVLARSREALAYLQERGAEVVPIKIPHLEIMALAHATNISMDFTLGHERQFFDDSKTLEPATRIQLALGGSMSGVEFLATGWVRGWSMDFFERLFDNERLSCIFTPTLATLPPRMPPAARYTGESNTTLSMELLKYIFPANLCGLPSISIPAGLSTDGLPIGVMVTAKHWDEHVCLRLANTLDVPRFQSVPPRFVDLLRVS